MKRLRLKYLFTIIAATIIINQIFQFNIHAEEEPFKATGYVKLFFLVVDPAEVKGLPQNDDVDNYVLGRGRLNLLLNPADNISAEFSYEMLPQYVNRQSNLKNPFLNVEQEYPYRAYDIHQPVYPREETASDEFVLRHNLDRAVITYSPSFCDIYAGRQPITFGSARAVNPTDIFTPFSFQDLDKEDRTGIDALRIKIPFGDMGELDAGAVFGNDLRQDSSAAFLRAKLYLHKTDITFMTINFNDNILTGIDIARAAGDAGFWLEAAYVFANLADDYIKDENYLRLSTGFDYHFSEGIYCYIEYHYNGAGSANSSGYLSQVDTTAFKNGSVYLLGQHYIIPGMSCEITPLLILDLQVLENLNDLSAFSSIKLSYNVIEDVYLECGGMISFGRPAEIVNPFIIKTEQEFGLYPDFYFLSARMYF